MNLFDETIKNMFSFLDNKYVYAGVYLFLMLYASLVAPKLPSYIVKIFDNLFVKLLFFFLIVYVIVRNPTVAIVATISVMVILLIINNIKTTNETMADIEKENDSKGTISEAECPCNFNTQNEDLGFDQYNVDQPMDYDDLKNENELNLYNKCNGANHEIENMLKRRDENIRVQLFPNVENLHQQSSNIITGGRELFGQENQQVIIPEVSMEDLAEEVRRRVNGEGTVEEIKQKCDEVASEFKANIMRHYNRSEYNADGVVVGNDEDLKLYASI